MEPFTITAPQIPPEQRAELLAMWREMWRGVPAEMPAEVRLVSYGSGDADDEPAVVKEQV